MSSLTDLFGLQETDLLLDKAQARLAEIEASLSEPEELQAARAVLAEKEGILAEVRSRQTEAEDTAEQVRAKAAEIEKKLYAGTIKNAKELQDLDADLRSLKELLARREDEMLAVLEEAEAANAEAEAARAEVESLESAWKAGVAKNLAEKEKLLPEAETLQAKRNSEATGIDRSVLSLYDILRTRKGGQAVARVERGMCSGCRISLPVSAMQRVRSGNGIVQCTSCERILLT